MSGMQEYYLMKKITITKDYPYPSKKGPDPLYKVNMALANSSKDVMLFDSIDQLVEKAKSIREEEIIFGVHPEIEKKSWDDHYIYEYRPLLKEVFEHYMKK